MERAIDGRFGMQARAIRVLPFSAVTRAGLEEADAIVDEWLPR
jgi:hypothetical protein